MLGAERPADAVPSGVQRAALRARVARPLLPLHRVDRSEVRRRRDLGLPVAHAAAPGVAGGSTDASVGTSRRRRRAGEGAAASPPGGDGCCRPPGRVLACCARALAGCRQDMHDQPKYKPFERNAFFADQRASRPLVPGVGGARAPRRGPGVLHRQRRRPAPVAANPLPLTREVLLRGQERYNIYCSPCHDRVGSGEGMIVQRGYKQPPSFHDRPPAQRAGRLLLPGHDQRLRRHADLRAAGAGARPLGDRRLHPRPAAQPARRRWPTCRRPSAPRSEAAP